MQGNSHLVDSQLHSAEVDWGQEFQHNGWEANATHIAKVTDILDYLDTLKQEHDYDLVLITDGFDSWFQFGPEVIKSRFTRITKSLQASTKAMIGERAVTAEGITQSIVFSAQKDCGPPDEARRYRLLWTNRVASIERLV